MLKVIIMAAGEGTRMKSNISKVLHKINNKEIVRYVYDASKIKDSKTIIISGKNTKIIQEMFDLSLIHISEPTRQCCTSRMPSSA